MKDRRFIIEMGMGNDLHGQDYSKAALRAVENAMRRSSLPILGLEGLDRAALRIVVTIGVQAPERVDTGPIAALFPPGDVSITVTHGGLDSTNPQTGETIVIAAAAVEAFLPDQGAFRPT